MARAVVLAMAIVCLGISLGEGTEVEKVISVSDLMDGIRKHFDEMMLKLKEKGCEKAIGSAQQMADGTILLTLRCVEFRSGA